MGTCYRLVSYTDKSVLYIDKARWLIDHILGASDIDHEVWSDVRPWHVASAALADPDFDDEWRGPHAIIRWLNEMTGPVRLVGDYDDEYQDAGRDGDLNPIPGWRFFDIYPSAYGRSGLWMGYDTDRLYDLAAVAAER